MRQRLRDLRDTAEDGAVVVEFAIVFVLFITLLWGIFTYGVIFAVQQTVTHAAGEAARATVGVATEAEAKTLALSVAQGQLDWLGASGAPEIDDLGLAACPPPEASQTCVYVEYAYPWRADPIISPIFDIATPDVITGSAVITWDGS